MAGKLLIAGGGISSAEIHKIFLDMAGGEHANVAIVPTASGDARVRAQECKKLFCENGVALENIHIIKISQVDEPGWVNNGDDIEIAKTLDNIDAVWFTGGDQLRLAKALFRADGSATLVLDKLQALLNRGGLIGGTSAGAAVMSSVMIARGTSKGAYMQPVQFINSNSISLTLQKDSEQLMMTNGFGFFPYGIVDQHFDTRDRLGRLMKSISISAFSTGFGIDEDTAIIVDLDENKLQVIGTGKVVILKQVKESEPNMDFLQLTSLMEVKELAAGESIWLGQLQIDFRIQDSFGIVEHFELQDAAKIKDSFTPSLG